MPSTTVNTMLCTKVRRKMLASCPFRSLTATPVAMFCGEIILAKTPPDELVAAISTGLSGGTAWVAATTCRLPNRALPLESLPDRNTAIQPRKADSSGNSGPEVATPLPSV